MTQVYIPFYFDWANCIRCLPDAEYGRLIKGILDYAMNGGNAEVPNISPEAEIAYRFITSSIRRAEAKRYGASTPSDEKNPAPAKREKKKFKRIERCAPKSEAKEGILPTPSQEKQTNKCDNDTIKERIAGNQSGSPTIVQKCAPTREQVRNFFNSRGFKSNPDEFFNFYDSNGWRVGQNPMQNWHSSAENWELRAKREKTAA